MSGAGFILAINLFVAGLFAVAFFLVAANNRADKVARWFGLAYLCGIAYFAFEFILPLQQHPGLAFLGGFTAFLLALVSIAVGIAKRYRQPVPWLWLAGVTVVSIAGAAFSLTLPRADFVRMMFYQAPYAVMQGVCVWLIIRSRRRGPMDWGLMALFTLSAAQFLSKPYVAMMTGGPGATAQEYVATTYALYSQTAGAVLSVATGLLMLMLLVRDMLMEVTARSETDTLSGLFNRRGFEERAEPAIANCLRSGVPSAFVIADLDRFKSINDDLGHDAGDRVITVFAGLLKRSTPSRAIAARLGGEEFAVFLPGTNIAAARLFAESVRSAFAMMTIPGLPDDRRCSASFGVAETDGNESLSDLRRRADTALYAAKRAGRDRVTTAAGGSDAMSSHPFPLSAPRRTSG